MASKDEWYKQPETVDTSAVIDMANVDELSDYEVNFDESAHQRKSDGTRDETHMADMGNMREQFQQNMTEMVWQAGKQEAQKVFNVYGNIDILRPYFDVQPQEVCHRLLQSMIPRRPRVTHAKVNGELYGPLMLVFTLVALLLLSMKMSGHVVQEGTLMGTAFGVCFGYWLGASSFIYFIAYVCNTHITMLQMLSLVGYALTGHCAVLFIGIMFHPNYYMIFYSLCFTFGGLCTLKMVTVLISRTQGISQRLILCVLVTVIHLCFLLYLHFAYHKIVEDLDEILENKLKFVVPSIISPQQHSIHQELNSDEHVNILLVTTEIIKNFQ